MERWEHLEEERVEEGEVGTLEKVRCLEEMGLEEEGEEKCLRDPIDLDASTTEPTRTDEEEELETTAEGMTEGSIEILWKTIQTRTTLPLPLPRAHRTTTNPRPGNLQPSPHLASRPTRTTMSLSQSLTQLLSRSRRVFVFLGGRRSTRGS